MYDDVRCPYCNNGQNIDDPGYEEDEVYQDQCGSCEKMFTYTISRSVNYYAEKADCLNDGECDWTDTSSKHSPHSFSREQCSMCSEERYTDPEGRKKAVQDYFEELDERRQSKDL